MDATTVASNVTIGIDLGDRFSHYCVLDEAGALVDEGRLATTPAAFGVRLGSAPRARIALEVGTHSPWVSELLKSAGHEVLVANARRLRMIFDSDSKNDQLDARQLARVARLDPTLLYAIEHRGRAARVDLALVRARACLVTERTRLVNHVRGALKSFGVRTSKCSTPSFHESALESIPEELRAALSPILATLAGVNATIKAYDRQIEQLSRERYPETKLLRQVCGVGPVTALTYVLTLEDPRRIQNSRMVGAFLGLRPRKSQSGQRDPELGITKAGDRDLRRLLVQGAQYTLGPFGTDSDLRRWGLALAGRGGKSAKKRAVVAVARKLAVLLHRLWVTGEVYDPLRNANRRTKAKTASVA
jgi:transposase